MSPHTTKTITIKLDAPLDLKCGGQLPLVEVAYESYGTLNKEGTNAILVCHALTMDAHASNMDNPDIEPGWWNFLIGPGKPIDTNTFFVVCFNVLGGCKGTTGPLSTNPETSSPYTTDFPEITIEDMVTVQKTALEKLNVTQLYATIGGSLGGMQVLEWSVRYPEMVKYSIAIATGAQLSCQGLAFDIVGRQCILTDPEWNEGHYPPGEEASLTGLATARMLGHITYISKNMMDIKFGREVQGGLSNKGFNTAFAIESFLRYNSEKFIKRFDPNSYLYLSKAMDNYDMSHGFDSLEESLGRSRSEFLIISFSSDWLFPPENSIELAWTLTYCGKTTTYVNIETELGHDAFLVDAPEIEQMKNLIRSFMSRL